VHRRRKLLTFGHRGPAGSNRPVRIASSVMPARAA
jgi:hypothetical protein